MYYSRNTSFAVWLLVWPRCICHPLEHDLTTRADHNLTFQYSPLPRTHLASPEYGFVPPPPTCGVRSILCCRLQQPRPTTTVRLGVPPSPASPAFLPHP